MLAPELPIDRNIVLLGAVMAALLFTLIGLALRRRKRHSHRLAAAPTDQPLQTAARQPAESIAPLAPVGIAQISAIDGTSLLAAIDEASAESATSGRLPGLYLSLAQWQIDSGETRAAEEVLRKCIRSATTAGLKDTHAKARVWLGDLVQASGDPATACEHWQIARQLFHELRQTKEFAAVDARILRNGCPTDWVLTDF
ncbi:MAG: hypothetical protein WC829_19775 [Hyphomicrobium sp.]|jgi:hypothetical protein